MNHRVNNSVAPVFAPSFHNSAGGTLTSWGAIRLINQSGWSARVKNLARALLEWRDARTGELHPGVSTIASALGTSESTARAHIGEAVKCGALVIVGTRSGGRTPSRYRMVLPDSDAPNPPDSGGFEGSSGRGNPPGPHGQPTGIRPPSHRIPSSNPPDSGPEPSKDHLLNQPQTTVVDVFSQLGIDHLRGHPNATPDRMAWIAREAPRQRSPGGWAAACILKGWVVPPPSEADTKAARKRAREVMLARFDAMPEAQRSAIIAIARSWCPNLADPRVHLDNSPGIRGAVADVLAAREAPADRAAGAHAHRIGGVSDRDCGAKRCSCGAATSAVHCGHGEADERDSGGGQGERSNALRHRQGRGRGA